MLLYIHWFMASPVQPIFLRSAPLLPVGICCQSLSLAWFSWYPALPSKYRPRRSICGHQMWRGIANAGDSVVCHYPKVAAISLMMRRPTALLAGSLISGHSARIVDRLYGDCAGRHHAVRHKADDGLFLIAHGGLCACRPCRRIAGWCRRCDDLYDRVSLWAGTLRSSC